MADESLFLLEILVDKIIFMKSPCFTDKDFKTCISFNFLGLTPLVLCDDDRESCAASLGGPFIKEFNSGKSCLFPLKQADIAKASAAFPIKVEVYKALPCDCLPTKIQMGTCTIALNKEFAEAHRNYVADPKSVSHASLKDAFRLMTADNTEMGDLLVFMRISCFGKLIVTKFQGTGVTAETPFVGTEGTREREPCDPKKKHRESDEPCWCGKNKKPGHSLPCQGPGYSSVSTGPVHPCMDPDDPCHCSGPPPAPRPVASACRNTEAYCLHVPKGAGAPVRFDEMGTNLHGNDLKIKVPKDACIIKRISETHTAMQRPFGKSGNCDAPCAKNQISLDLPVEQVCCGGLKPQATHFTCTTEGCSTVGKHGTGGCNMVPGNVPGAAVATGKLHPNKDVFVLKIAKTSSDGDKKTKLELELVTPKGADKKLPTRMETREAQCEAESSGKKKNKKARKGTCEF